MRHTRYMSLLFLVLSLCFFLVPEFNQGFWPNLRFWFYPDPDAWLESVGAIPKETLQAMAAQGEDGASARTLAFVALHADSPEEAFRLAGKAVEVQPNLTWTYAVLHEKFHEEPIPAGWAEALEAWDRDNAYAHLHGAELLWREHGLDTVELDQEGLNRLARDADWRAQMETAFSASRYGSYRMQQFELERLILREEGLAHPATLMLSLSRRPISSLPMTLNYVHLLTRKLGPEAERTGRTEQALRYYWSVLQMGARMQDRANTPDERLVGESLLQIATARLIPSLERSRRSVEAGAIRAMQKQLTDLQASLRGEDPLSTSSNYRWAAMLVQFFAAWVVVFGLMSAVAIVVMSVVRYALDSERGGSVTAFFTLLENYAPVILFVGCLGFYLAYYPYAQNFQHYLTAEGSLQNFESFYANVFPVYGMAPGLQFIPVQNPFSIYGSMALITVFILSVGLWWFRRTPAA